MGAGLSPTPALFNNELRKHKYHVEAPLFSYEEINDFLSFQEINDP